MLLSELEMYHIKRRRLKITLQEIADYLRVHKTSISKYERGEMNFQYAQEYKNYIDKEESNKKG